MTKYRIEDLKVGAVFEDGGTTRTIITVGKKEVFYSYQSTFGYVENVCRIGELLRGERGELIEDGFPIEEN